MNKAKQKGKKYIIDSEKADLSDFDSFNDRDHIFKHKKKNIVEDTEMNIIPPINDPFKGYYLNDEFDDPRNR